MEIEKRRRERFAMSQVIELSTSEGQQVKAQGVNISEGGLLCQTDTEIPLGTLVSFQLSIPSGKSTMSVACEGLVLRNNSNNGKYDVVIDFFDSDNS